MGSLDHLWAGWRSDFVSGAPDGAAPGIPETRADVAKARDAQISQSTEGSPSAQSAQDPATGRSGQEGCVFCDILATGLPDEDLHIVWRHPSGRVFAILNAYPYTSGHLMVMPVRHAAELEQLTSDESGELWQAVALGLRALKAAYKPEGINIGANLGRAAGAGVPGHFHMHIVPRWVGDTNFMTSVADARVLPEPLSESAAKLRDAWPSS